MNQPTEEHWEAEEHHWEDISYHGSPYYECAYCRISKTNQKAQLPCPKAEEHAQKQAKEQERKDRTEYEELKQRKQREEELQNKYGWLSRPPVISE